MITIHFTQCDPDFKQDDLCQEAFHKPIIARCSWYEEILRGFAESGQNHELSTYDEHLLLIAQYLKRKGVIRDNLAFVSHCCHDHSPRIILIDEEGDITDDIHHGFFHQRLMYLR